MNILRGIFRVIGGGPLVADQLDDKAERIAATGFSRGWIILCSCVGLAVVIAAVRCG